MGHARRHHKRRLIPSIGILRQRSGLRIAPIITPGMETIMLVGYGRVSTQDQSPALQEDALRAAGCEKLFIEKVSSGKKDRPQLAAALDYVREGDALVVWRLDRLARSLHQLIETVEALAA